MYTWTKAKEISPDGETHLFEIKAGVLQEELLAPYLILDYALRKAVNGREEKLGFKFIPRRSKRKQTEIVTDPEFADETALLSGEIGQAQTLFDRVEAAAASVWLMVNAKKAKVMCFNQPDKVLLDTADGTSLEIVGEFTYLGSLVSSSAADI